MNNKPGRRPPKGIFPSCDVQQICRAQSIRTHDACKNCAITPISLKTFIEKQGSRDDLYQLINKQCNNCMDLLTRIISCIGTQKNYSFEKVVLFIYKQFGDGNVSDRYIHGELENTLPSDGYHARMILEKLNLTCYKFDQNHSDMFTNIEDLIYCTRHTPILSVRTLKNIFKRYERNQRRKRKVNKISISDIKKKNFGTRKTFKQKN